MRISLRLDQLDSHAHFAVFVNGGKAGDLCLTRDEWHAWREVIESGCKTHGWGYRIDDNRHQDSAV